MHKLGDDRCSSFRTTCVVHILIVAKMKYLLIILSRVFMPMSSNSKWVVFFFFFIFFILFLLLLLLLLFLSLCYYMTVSYYLEQRSIFSAETNLLITYKLFWLKSWVKTVLSFTSTFLKQLLSKHWRIIFTKLQVLTSNLK